MLKSTVFLTRPFWSSLECSEYGMVLGLNRPCQRQVGGTNFLCYSESALLTCYVEFLQALLHLSKHCTVQIEAYDLLLMRSRRSRLFGGPSEVRSPPHFPHQLKEGNERKFLWFSNFPFTLTLLPMIEADCPIKLVQFVSPPSRDGGSPSWSKHRIAACHRSKSNIKLWRNIKSLILRPVTILSYSTVASSKTANFRQLR